MKVTVFGSYGGTGKKIVNTLLKQAHTVSCPRISETGKISPEQPTRKIAFEEGASVKAAISGTENGVSSGSHQVSP